MIEHVLLIGNELADVGICCLTTLSVVERVYMYIHKIRGKWLFIYTIRFFSLFVVALSHGCANRIIIQ